MVIISVVDLARAYYDITATKFSNLFLKILDSSGTCYITCMLSYFTHLAHTRFPRK